jgi:hypothetical protein
VIEFDQPISDVQVFALLKLAYGEMIVKSSTEALSSEQIPATTTALPE